MDAKTFYDASKSTYGGAPGLKLSDNVCLTCTDAEYEANLKQMQALKAPAYVFFTASLEAQDTPWCPDCGNSVGVVAAAVGGIRASLLQVQLEKPAWKNTENPHRFRSAPLNLTGIPTLVLFNADGTEAKRVGPELEAASDSEAAMGVVAKFIASKSA